MILYLNRRQYLLKINHIHHMNSYQIIISTIFHFKFWLTNSSHHVCCSFHLFLCQSLIKLIFISKSRLPSICKNMYMCDFTPKQQFITNIKNKQNQTQRIAFILIAMKAPLLMFNFQLTKSVKICGNCTKKIIRNSRLKHLIKIL